MLLKTKFLAPAYNTKSVGRERLMERLTPRSARKLVLISAPAGYGKTTLISQWLHTHERTFCWLSLDEHDNDSNRFWQYVIGAIATAIPGFGTEAQRYVEATVTNEAAVTAIINELNDWSLGGNELSIVLDDFHTIQNNEILREFAYFIDFLPLNIEIVITTRFEPRLPISRWSVKNWVDHLYSKDLVFSYEESRIFFNKYMGLSLTDKQIEQIFRRTEGWIAAMQLAAISASTIQANEQPYLSADQLFADERHFSDYVLSEILDHQPPVVRDFLLDTSCLLRISADLCNAVREKTDSQEIVEKLLEANLFLIPLDLKNEWFRYHDMFRESLLNKLKNMDPGHLKALQKRAVSYLIDHDLAHEAIEQVVQLEDWELLASLLETNGNRLIHEGNHLAVLHWLARVPDSIMSASPRLIMLKIWGLFFSNRLDDIRPLLDALEALIDQQRIDNVATSTHELIDLHSEISLIRSYLARSQSDFSSASRLTRQVLEELDHTNMPLKSVTYYGIGLDNYTVGDLSSAEKALSSAIEHGKHEKKYTTVLSSSGLLGWIYFYQGKMEQALETGIHNQQWNVSYADPSQPRVISCWQNSVLAMIYIEKAEFTVAETYINPLLKHLQVGTEPSLHIIIQFIRAHFLFAQKQYVEAITCLDDALNVYQHKKDVLTFEPPSLSSLKARCLIAMGKPDKARKVLEELGKVAQNSAPLVFEDIRLTRIRIELAEKSYATALDELEQLIPAIEAKNHIYHLIQAYALKAIALVLQDREDEASEAIHASLALAATDGFISVYRNESTDITKALALCNDPTLPDSYLQRLNESLGTQTSITARQTSSSELPGAAALGNKLQLLEPLSQRELEVLDLIELGLANKEIANKLSLAPATVKAHIRNIYGKIQAKSRTEALSKARQFGLL